MGSKKRLKRSNSEVSDLQVEYMPGYDASSSREGIHQRSFARWKPDLAEDHVGLTTMKSYRPTEKEWQDPMDYISKITEEASAYGMAHIIPPESWDPPFAIQCSSDGIDFDSFVFGVRKQPTHKLCRRKASNRAKDFGFSSIKGTYTLGEFACHADWAKSVHFSDPKPTGLGQASEDDRRCEYGLSNQFPMAICPSVEEVEREFWRIVEGKGEEKVDALYGSDLDNLVHGSGFPMPSGERWHLLRENFRKKDGKILNRDKDSFVQEYRDHPWNVNNLSLSSKSLLHYLHEGGDTLISGLMVPWMYVGSCFAAFNWHIEDHALYSVNYIHCGSPKVWYSVPGDCSDLLEEAMKDALPHLFDACPSLLYQLITQISPKELMKRGVPVYRVVHTPRSFIVTMPNAYHDGFNTGFNVAESVNFAALPWLPYGSAVVKKYQYSKKPVTISHDALLCKLVLDAARSDGSEFSKEIRSVAVDELRKRIEELQHDWDAMVGKFSSLGLDISSVPDFCQRDSSCEAPNTKESDCIHCKSDLWLISFFSTEDKTKHACINHAHLLAEDFGFSLDSIRMTYQFKISELTNLLSRVEHDKQTRKATASNKQMVSIKKIGPIWNSEG